MSSAIILREDEYLHVLNKETGEIELVEGPLRLTLASNQQVTADGVQKKVILREAQWCRVSNPYAADYGDCIMGQVEVRVGPTVFSLYPEEEVHEGIQDALVLNANEGIVVQAIRDYEKRTAGELWQVFGPTRYIPTKHEKVISAFKAINIGQNEAIYVRDTRTSELKIVYGPKTYVLDVFEELYQKQLSKEEYAALQIPPKKSHVAYSVQLRKNECLCVVDHKDNKERYVVGPKSVILGPHDGVKVVSVSGDVPKRENVLWIAAVRLGPDFMTDSFQIRTKDNALLRLTLTYKWRLIINEDERQIAKIFEHDFIGYACQSLMSRVRECAAHYEFEVFHSKSAEILRSSLFKEKTYKNIGPGGSSVSMFGRFFSETNLLIYELDVQQVEPVDEEIAELLSENLRKNMSILSEKIESKARYAAEEDKIRSEIEIAKMRKSLIQIENANYEKTEVERARITGVADIEKAMAEKDSEEMMARAKMDLEVDKMKSVMKLLSLESGKRYVDLLRAKTLSQVERATVVPTETKTLFLPAHAQPEYVAHED